MSTSTESIQKKFTKALDELVAQVKQDRSILAAILCGSLSHDTVWAKSDIDLALVTIDDKKLETTSLALNVDGVNVHAFLMPRAEFRKTVEGSVRNSFMHSLLAKGRLLYTHDETIAALCARLNEIGERDTQVQLLSAATRLARIEVLGARLLADREVILQAMKLNPSFFRTIYTDLLNAKKTRKNVQAALDAVDDYLARRAPTLFRLVLDHLREVGEARSSTEIEAHFKRNFDVEGVSTACEYLADQGLIAKVSTPVQLTKRSNVLVQEQAFVYMGEAADGD